MSVPLVRDGDNPRDGWSAWVQGWAAWRNRIRLFDHVRFERNPDVRAHEATGQVETPAGSAEGCFTCQGSGVVFVSVPAGLRRKPCPSCEARVARARKGAA